mmetsp:Transcript_24194/g.61286  ORF Transcript_24194/g.61286 Transcript_24194/m.61286 type:complete len:474 (-) Transcript_24194:733-2154(-)
MRLRCSPGGASKVTLSEAWSTMGEKDGCASVVSHSRNSGCGVRLESSLASAGTQPTTRCKFLRHTQSPRWAPSRTSCSAGPVCCPPIASGLKRPGMTREARSSSSALGSTPAVVIMRMGCVGSFPSAATCCSELGAVPRFGSRSRSHAKEVSAAPSRSGRSAWSSSRNWKRRTELGIERGGIVSGEGEPIHCAHSGLLASPLSCTSCGSVVESRATSALRSAGTQPGTEKEPDMPPACLRVKRLQSASANSCGASERARCSAKVSRSSLMSERATAWYVRCCRSTARPLIRSCAPPPPPPTGAASEALKRRRKPGSENWYMWLSRRRSTSAKKTAEPITATGRYTSRWRSSETCSSVDCLSFSEMVFDLALVSLSDSSSALFSRMLPVEVASSLSSSRSRSSRCTLSSSSAASSALFCDSSSGCSCWMVRPSSCPSSPPRVTEKLTSVTSAAESGGRSGVWLRVARISRNESL